MTISELVRSMAAAGATPEAIAIAVEAIEARDRRETERKAERAAARKRQRMLRDMAATVARHGGDDDATVAASVPPTSPPKDNYQTPHTTPSETNDAARKPHRMPRDFRLSEPDREFARDLGWSESEIDDGEAELVDYWSNPKLPASKALKLDWSAVWRNRVRDLGKRRGSASRPFPANGQRNGQRSHHQPSKMDAKLAAMATVFLGDDEPGLPSEDPGSFGFDDRAEGRGFSPRGELRSVPRAGDEAGNWGDRHAPASRLSG